MGTLYPIILPHSSEYLQGFLTRGHIESYPLWRWVGCLLFINDDGQQNDDDDEDDDDDDEKTGM